MKIFGWMHKKLHLGTTEYQRVAHRNSPDVHLPEENTGKTQAENETEALHLLPQVLLTIGTFGHSTPARLRQSQEEEEVEIEIEKEEEDEEPSTDLEEEKPKLTKQASVHDLATMTPLHSSTSELIKPQCDGIEMIKMEDMVRDEITQEEVISKEPLLKEDKEKVFEKRTTLADLFAAESEHAGENASPKVVALAGVGLIACVTTKKAKKAKTKKMKKGEESSLSGDHGTKKIHQLITRMLKKKIHPDMTRWNSRRGGLSDGGEARTEETHLTRG